MSGVRRAAATALTALLLLGGCGGPDTPSYTPIPPGRSTEDPQDKIDERDRKRAGARLQEGDGYWYAAPKGWRDATRRFRKKQKHIDTASSAGPPSEGYADSVGIWTAPATGPLALELPELGAAYRRKLGTYALGVRKVPGKHVIDGRDAVMLSGQARFGRVPSELEQYVVIANEQVYVITFTLAASLSDDRHRELVKQVLGTWHWT